MVEIKETIGLAEKALKKPKAFSCIAGVSLGTKHYTYKPNVKAYIDFLTQNFDNILIFINDFNYHWDVMAFQNLNKEEALQKAKNMGEEIQRNYQKIIRGHFSNAGKRIEIVKFFDLVEDNKYRTFENSFHAILKENLEVKNVLNKDLETQILYTPSIKEKISKLDQSAQDFCRNYVLDQLIANLYLMFKQPKSQIIRVSPTPYKYFLTLKKVLEDKYNNFRDKLGIKKDWGYLGICLPRQDYEK